MSTPRLDYLAAAPLAIQALSSAGKYLHAEKFDPKLKCLVELRVSQINGCAYCLSLHTQEARALGEKQQRLDCLSAWRETDFYTEREQAALAWAETLTLISEKHAPDDIYAAVAKHFPGKELVDLTLAIVNMNAWNRIAIGFHKPVPVREEK
ncbi:MAG TPA: carboxymuconolactone decarboxylase family protein [Candidatus Methylacidiphilales bacterium]|jgi:AhpD family alkylhydroperoxidase|nr:carboxymuconolactone decarboxylase family protein [Candidatus Methylacidiphilales bacterium]